MTLLNGQEGIRIESTPVPYDLVLEDTIVLDEARPDSLAAVGDIDANGFNDLAISHRKHGILIVFGGRDSPDAVINSSALPKGFAMHLLDSNEDNYMNIAPAKVGDIDNDGVDDLSVASLPGNAVIIYGAADALPELLDLASPMNVELTRVQGISNEHFSTMMVALGDINNDGADDLGIGWSDRYYLRDMKSLGDINDDGIEDVFINGYADARTQLLCVLYGFPAEGFTGFLPATTNPKPLVLVEEDYFNRMVNALDSAARFAINTLNENARLGIDSGPTAEACLNSSTGTETGEIEQFSCPDGPLTISYDWPWSYDVTGTARYASVAYADGALMELSFTSGAIPEEKWPGYDNHYGVFVNYNLNGVVEFNTGLTADHPVHPYFPRLSCSINVATRITTDDPHVCMDLLSDAIVNMKLVFGENNQVEKYTLLP